MQCSFAAAAILAFTSSVVAQTAGFAAMTIPTQNQNVAVGSILEITWQPSTQYPGPITIELLQGATPSTLEVGQTIAASIDQSSGKFPWTVPQNLPSYATYGFKITLDSSKASANTIFQFSFPFQVTGLSGAAPSSPAPAPAAPHVAGGYPADGKYPAEGTTTVHLTTPTVYPAHPATVPAAVVNTPPYVTAAPSASGPAAPPPAPIYPTANATLSTAVRPSASVSGSAPPAGTDPVLTVSGNAASSIACGGLVAAAGMVLALAM